MAVKAVLFDFGGVLVFHVNRSYAGKLSRRLKIPYKQVLDFVESKADDFDRGKLSNAKFWSEFRRRFGSRMGLDEGMNLYKQSFVRRKCAFSLAKSLSRKCPVGILSNMSLYLKNFCMKKYNLSFFKFNFFSSDYGVIKPDRRFYVLAARKMGLKPSEIVFIDDKIDNVNGALRAGMKSFQYKSIRDARWRLKRWGISG